MQGKENNGKKYSPVVKKIYNAVLNLNAVLKLSRNMSYKRGIFQEGLNEVTECKTQ